jgi:hypothetical protein
VTLFLLSLHFLKKKRAEKKVKVAHVGNIFVLRVRVQHCTCVRVLSMKLRAHSSQLKAHSLTRAVLLCCSAALRRV